MQRITLPPSVSQRKHVSRLSILLGSISLQDLKACTMVSRLFRYSGRQPIIVFELPYFAAYQQLLRTFPGARLRNVLSAYPSNVTNFWPYFSYRIDEVVERKSIYEASFLGRTVKGIYTISDNLWTSPDDPKQITIAVRFLLTRVFFWISLGLGDDMTQPQNSRYKVILEAQEVVPQEIWKVTVQSDFTLITYYVLEDTCEVIGEQIADGISPVTDFRNLRIDWSTYIASRRYLPTPSVNKDTFGLLEHLQWSNHEEYNKGISKVWLSRVEREGDIGSAKLEVARRYVLACVVGNSVSGPRLTSNQMQQEFNGLSNIRDSVAIKSDRINMFLPAHHHVESLHFTLSNGRNLHPALATVQTPGREYYILKDNGMQVGCEEDGVADVWMELLGCKNSGCI
ncbi:hypothetical protein BDN70DRAFT_975720 [Pholiota conissans]|uniref:Uncharacterized protein n=1 Tax=Pholiota conissans TaxID=109636 RepID=A0A9P5Z833_9AGAR|nr:hypothetical protein BDN70DRAFT_975720 [Pholiota conissans]